MLIIVVDTTYVEMVHPSDPANNKSFYYAPRAEHCFKAMLFATTFPKVCINLCNVVLKSNCRSLVNYF